MTGYIFQNYQMISLKLVHLLPMNYISIKKLKF